MTHVPVKFHPDFLAALMAGNRSRCAQIAKDTLNNRGSIIQLYESIIKPSLYQVGQLWESNKISVATEHLATSVTEAVLNELYDQIISEKRLNKKVIVACVENEFHQVGIKMVADVFEKNGWDAFFLGANIPTQALISFAQSTKPDAVALSLSIYFHLPVLEKMIQKIRTVFPQMPILVGGQAFCHGGIDILKKYSKVTYLDNLNTLELFIHALNHETPMFSQT
jgi:methanogenic corrinoid protein MtbC1